MRITKLLTIISFILFIIFLIIGICNDIVILGLLSVPLLVAFMIFLAIDLDAQIDEEWEELMNKYMR